jgi:hypothetical protein
MASQAEAERERRARVITAEGEQQAAERLKEASQTMAEGKGSLYLRTLQTIQETASEQGTNTVIPLPIEFLKALEPDGEGLPFVGGGGSDPDEDDGSEDVEALDDVVDQGPATEEPLGEGDPDV